MISSNKIIRCNLGSFIRKVSEADTSIVFVQEKSGNTQEERRKCCSS